MGYLVTTKCQTCEGEGSLDGLCRSNLCLGGDYAFGGPCPQCGGTGGERTECPDCKGLCEIETEIEDAQPDGPAAVAG